MSKQYPRVIQPTAVLVGDLIELTDESRPDWLERDRAVRGGAGVLVGRWVMDNLSRLTVTLLERPAPTRVPLPTEPGTLIRAEVRGLPESVFGLGRSGRWHEASGSGSVRAEQVTAWSPLVAIEPVGDDWLAGHGADYREGALLCVCGWRVGSNRTLDRDDLRAYARHLLTEALGVES